MSIAQEDSSLLGDRACGLDGTPHLTDERAGLWREGRSSRHVGGVEMPSSGLSGPVVDTTWLQLEVLTARSVLADLAQRATGDVATTIDAATAVDLIDELESLAGTVAAAQARLTVVLDAHTRAAQAHVGVPAEKRGAGVAAQVALARRESPRRGAIHLGLAKALTTELPATMTALAMGRTTEYRALLVTRATAVLDPDTRRGVDATIGPELAGLSDRGVDSRARALTYHADPHAFLKAAGRAADDRDVSIRPAPDVMAVVAGCVPAPDGVACYAALDSTARSLRAAGDGRTLSQLRADLFVGRLTGRDPVDAPADVEIGLVMTDRALLGGPATTGDENDDGTPRDDDMRRDISTGVDIDVALDPNAPAHLVGYGPVPAPWARAFLRGPSRHPGPTALTEPTALPAPTGVTGGERDCQERRPPRTGDRATDEEGGRMFIRRLLTSPIDGSVQDIDTGRRLFTGNLRRAIIHRDRTCRTPWCDAPIREVDHVVSDADGGAATWDNGQGLCQACNLAKTAPGWRGTVTASGPPGARTHEVTTRTPTGHRYRSLPPPAVL